MVVKFCDETRNRIKLSVAAYAYEFKDNPIMSDADFDELASKIDTSVSTTNPRLDYFFAKNFQSDTGMWIHKHPELSKIEYLYERYYK
jgi:hypothetical protein